MRSGDEYVDVFGGGGIIHPVTLLQLYVVAVCMMYFLALLLPFKYGHSVLPYLSF